MNEKHKKALQANLHDICTDLDAEGVLPYLREKGIIQRGEAEVILALTRTETRNAQLIDFITAAGPLAFQVFINALQICNKEYLAKKILTHLPSSSTQQLLPESIPNIKQSLKDIYLTRFQKVYPFSLPFTFDIENNWVSLALKDESYSQATEDHAELLKRTFDKVKILIIEGDPATGKTSLMRRLTHEWANGKQELQHYELVLYAEFREVREKIFKNIADLVLGGLEEYLTKEGYEDLKKLVNDERFCKEYRILVLLDGYDESSLEKQCSEFSSYMKEKTIKKPLLFDTVITTRKGYLSNLRGREGRFVFAEVLGFTTDEQKEKYILNHFHSSKIDNKENIATVHHLLDNNENLNKLAETPLFLTFICLVHERIIDGTLLELYCNIIWWLIDRHQQDFPDRDIPALFGFQNGSSDKFKTIQDHYLHFPQLHRLGKMAVRNLQENVFGYSDCEQFHLQPIIEQVGLLINERNYDKSFKIVTSFHFPHRTIQEFLAAFYCFCSYEPASECFSYDFDLDISIRRRNEFERFLFRIALSDRIPIQAEKRKYYFERINNINLDMGFDAFNTTAGFNNELLNWFLSLCTNVINILLLSLNSARHESNSMNDASIHYGSVFTSKMSNPTLFSFSDLMKLHTLTISGCTFSADSQLSFTNCPFLTVLQFSNCEMKSSTIVGIATLPAIYTVTFDRCNIDLATWQSITDQISNSIVKCLKITADFFVQATYTEFLHHLQKCEHIQQIHVRDVYDLNITDSIMKCYEESVTANLALTAQKLPALTSITILDVGDGPLDENRRLSERSRKRIEKAGQQRYFFGLFGRKDFSIYMCEI